MNISRRRLLGASATHLAAGSLLYGSAAGPAASALGFVDGEAPSDADIGFCTDMVVHHVQALAMCQRVLGRRTGDPVQAAAAEVLQNQAMEVGQMRAWLTDWGASTVFPTTVMGWMGANDGAGIPLANMPGYATDAELRGLSTAKGWRRGKRWLVLMRAHHVGGVAMATMAAQMAAVEKTRRLATAQVAVQTFEISQYDELLAGPYSRSA